MEEEPDSFPQILSQCHPKSPEFEFWMVRNPSFPQPNLLTADQLFSDGVLLPLHHLHLSHDHPPPQPPPPELEPSGSDQPPKPESSTVEISSSTSTLTSSKRWRDIFKKTDKKGSPATADSNGDDHSAKEKDNNSVKERKRDKKNGGAGGGNNGVSAAELNINIWPFSRSRSAGNAGARPRSAAAANRKGCSAPCSRSNSAGESKSRKWPSSPGRGGVHLGRGSPVWQVRRGGRNAEAKKDGNDGRRRIPAAVAGGSPKTKVLSLNVPMCIGYRSQLSCRSDQGVGEGVAGEAHGGDQKGGGIAGEGVRGSNLFNIKNLFAKKVY